MGCGLGWHGRGWPAGSQSQPGAGPLQAQLPPLFPERSLCSGNVLDGPAEIEGLVDTLWGTWWGAFQTLERRGPQDNAVYAACQRILTAFPATPLGALAGLSNFTRDADLVGRDANKGLSLRPHWPSVLAGRSSACQIARPRHPPALLPSAQDDAECIDAESIALPFSLEQPRPDDTEWYTQYMAQGCMQGAPIRCGRLRAATRVAASLPACVTPARDKAFAARAQATHWWPLLCPTPVPQHSLLDGAARHLWALLSAAASRQGLVPPRVRLEQPAERPCLPAVPPPRLPGCGEHHCALAVVEGQAPGSSARPPPATC